MEDRQPLFKIGDVVHPNFIPGSHSYDYPYSFVEGMRDINKITITRIEPASPYHKSKEKYNCWFDGMLYFAKGNSWTWTSSMFKECQEF